MEPLRFRREFVGRLLRIARRSTLGIAATTAAACGSSENSDAVRSTHGNGGSAGSGASATTGGNAGLPTGGTGGVSTGGSGGNFTGGTGGSPVDGSAATGGTGATGGAGGAPPQSCGSAMAGDGGELLDASSDAWRGELVCRSLPRDDAGACPSACDAVISLDCISFDRHVTDVYGGPYPTPDACCYDVKTDSFPCYVGRTFFIDEGVVTAELRDGESWRTGPTPDLVGLDRRTRDALGAAWARDGLFEHASVASFARFVMQLLAVGAPADLVRDAHAAAVDEVAHAELSLALASAYLGRSVEPGALPFSAALEIDDDLAAIAFETVMEGCIGETVATLQALDALELATDPAVRQVLERTVHDEARHAELAWRFMAWALAAGGPRTHIAVARAFEAFQPPPPRAEELNGVDLDAYRAHGRQPAVEARAVAERVLRDVVRPVSQALLATSTSVKECARAA